MVRRPLHSGSAPTATAGNSCRIPTQLSARGLNVVLVDLLPSVDHQLEGVAVVLEGNPVGAVDLMRALDGNIIWRDGDHL